MDKFHLVGENHLSRALRVEGQEGVLSDAVAVNASDVDIKLFMKSQSQHGIGRNKGNLDGDYGYAIGLLPRRPAENTH